MPSREEPVVDWEAQIVIVQFHKSRLEVFCLAEVSSKGVSLELKAPAEHRHEEADEGRVGSCDVLHHDHQTDQGWLGVGEAKCLIERARFAEVAKQSKQGEDLNLCYEDVFEDMVHLPVTKFMSKHCHDLLIVATGCLFLLSLALLLLLLCLLLSFLLLFFISFQLHPFRLFQQCVKEDNPFELEESVEVGVAVAGPLATLNHVELVQWERDGGSKAFNLSLEFSFRHWGVFVKERCNEVRIDGHQEEGDEDDKAPEIDKEVVAAPVDNLDHASENRRLDRLGHQELFDLVHCEEACSLLVEPVILLHHKGAVDGEGEGGDGGEDGEIECEQEGGEDLTVRRILSEGIKRIQGPAPEKSVPKHPEQHSGEKLAENSLHCSELRLFKGIQPGLREGLLVQD